MKQSAGEIRNDGKPYYDKRKKTWKVDIPGYGTESGNLTNVVYTFLRTSMFFPYESGKRNQDDFEPHCHEYEHVLAQVVYDPEEFMITEDQKQLYSELELTLL